MDTQSLLQDSLGVLRGVRLEGQGTGDGCKKLLAVDSAAHCTRLDYLLMTLLSWLMVLLAE